METREETSSCDFWTKLVYLLGGLAVILMIFPLGRMKERYVATSQEAAAVTEAEKAETKKIFLQIVKLAELKGKEYSPEDYFRDRAIIVPLRDKFARLEGWDSDFQALHGVLRGALANLFYQSQNNFPWSRAPVSRNSVTLSPKQRLKNQLRWQEAEANAPLPQRYEPISISFSKVLSFVKWLLLSYLKFLPCSCLLILFHIFRRRLSLSQELILRPWFFFSNVLKGPVGIAIYSGVDPAFEWRYAQARTRYMWKSRKSTLSTTEEKVIWLQAREPILTFNQALQRVGEVPNLILQKSRFAIGISSLAMIIATPILAATGGFIQKPPEQFNVQTLLETEEELRKQESSYQVVTVEAVILYTIELFQSIAPAVRVEPGQQIVSCWVSGRWFLPPSLAPPLTRRQEK